MHMDSWNYIVTKKIRFFINPTFPEKAILPLKSEAYISLSNIIEQSVLIWQLN